MKTEPDKKYERSIRVTPDGRFSVSDALKAIGQKGGSRAWWSIKRDHPALAQESSRHAFGIGRPSVVLPVAHFLRLLGTSGTMGRRALMSLDIPMSAFKGAGFIPDRPEQIFGAFLNEALPQMCVPLTVATQKNCASFRIDFYIPEALLAVEYDEPHHSRNQEADRARQAYIEQALGCEFVRVPHAESTRELAYRIAGYAAIRAEALSIMAGLPEIMHAALLDDIAALRRKHLGTRQHPHGGLLSVSL